MRTIAVENNKGGVGKTTVAYNLATLLALICRVLLIDLDTDRCLTDGLAGGGFEAKQVGKRSILDVLLDLGGAIGGATIPYDLARFAGAAPASLKPSGRGSLHFIAGSDELADAPALFDQRGHQPVATFPQALPWLLRQREITDQFDVVVIDIGPGIDPVTLSGVYAADHTITPVEPASLSIEALKRHQMRLSKANTARAKAGVGGRTELLGVLLSRVNVHSAIQLDFAAKLRAGLQAGRLPCFQAQIPASDAVLIATSDHTPVWAAYPSDPAAQAFAALAGEVLAA